ncbi:MAG: maleylpyruvate isomerase N-terminal domain-containing protein [Chloroflexia bacterium]
MQAVAPVLVAELFPEVDRALVELLRGLTAEQWDVPTVCAGWSVKDVALHLLGGDLGNLSRRRDGVANPLAAYAPPGADFSDNAVLVAALGRWNEGWVEATRRLSPRVICDLFAAVAPEVHAYYASLDPLALGGPVTWAGSGPAPVWLDIAREYTEHWAHQAQIRDALGLPALQSRRLYAPVLAAYMHALPHTLRDVAAPEGTTLRVVITGEAGGEWVAVREGAGWVLGGDPARPAQATATLDQDAAWRLFTRGLGDEAAERAVRVEGDAALAGAVRRMVAIIA